MSKGRLSAKKKKKKECGANGEGVSWDNADTNHEKYAKARRVKKNKKKKQKQQKCKKVQCKQGYPLDKRGVPSFPKIIKRAGDGFTDGESNAQSFKKRMLSFIECNWLSLKGGMLFIRSNMQHVTPS